MHRRDALPARSASLGRPKKRRAACPLPPPTAAAAHSRPHSRAVLQPLAMYEHGLCKVYFLGESEESGAGRRPFKEQTNELIEAMKKWGGEKETGSKKKEERCAPPAGWRGLGPAARLGTRAPLCSFSPRRYISSGACPCDAQSQEEAQRWGHDEQQEGREAQLSVGAPVFACVRRNKRACPMQRREARSRRLAAGDRQCRWRGAIAAMAARRSESFFLSQQPQSVGSHLPLPLTADPPRSSRGPLSSSPRAESEGPPRPAAGAVAAAQLAEFVVFPALAAGAWGSDRGGDVRTRGAGARMRARPSMALGRSRRACRASVVESLVESYAAGNKPGRRRRRRARPRGIGGRRPYEERVDGDDADDERPAPRRHGACFCRRRSQQQQRRRPAAVVSASGSCSVKSTSCERER